MNSMIMVGIDQSAPSRAALEWTMRRAEDLKAPVTLVHAVYDTWIAPDYVYYDVVLESAQAVLDAEAVRAAELAPSVTLRKELRIGDAPQVLSDLSTSAGLVVVGTNRKGRFDGEFFGSVSLQVASASDCPVAVIPVLPSGDRVGVVVGVDGSPGSLAAIAFAAEEADRLGEDLYALYVATAPRRGVLQHIPEGAITRRTEEERVVLGESVAGLSGRYPGLRVHEVFETDASPAKVLVDAAENARLLVVGNRGRGAVKSLLLGSVSHSVLLNIPCPTIVVRSTAERR